MHSFFQNLFLSSFTDPSFTSVSWMACQHYWPITAKWRCFTHFHIWPLPPVVLMVRYGLLVVHSGPSIDDHGTVTVRYNLWSSFRAAGELNTKRNIFLKREIFTRTPWEQSKKTGMISGAWFRRQHYFQGVTYVTSKNLLLWNFTLHLYQMHSTHYVRILHHSLKLIAVTSRLSA